MTEEQLTRYNRQMQLPGVGEEGQLKLLRSKVLIVGAGGLGSPIALYLAAAGVGNLGIIDHDSVSLSNIHRQVLYGASDVGSPKAECAAAMLRRINPDITLAAYQEKLTAQNAPKLIDAYDVVIDGSDNFETKFLLNDAAFFAGKPYIFGGAVGFGGQASVFFPRGGGPCLRCMFPEIPYAGEAAAPGGAPVLGTVPGQIGMIQAGEALKLLLGIGRPLIGRFLVYNCLELEFRAIAVKRSADCPLCGESPSIVTL